jgi:CelD/BcsL family acetyltransferase involved in cellulose biosynthesis
MLGKHSKSAWHQGTSITVTPIGACPPDQFAEDMPDVGISATLHVMCVSWTEIVTDTFTAQWDIMAAGVVDPNPFYESWFLLPALQQFDPDGKVKILAMWQGNALTGLLPVSNSRIYGRWPIAHHVNWLHPNAFLGAPLVMPGFEHEFWEQVFKVMDCASGKSLFFHINGLVIGSPIQQALEQVCAAQTRRFALVDEQERALLHGPANAEEYYANAVRGKKRKELRRQKNRLAEIGDLQFQRSDGGANLENWIDEFLALERASWKGEGGSALDCMAETRILFRQALRGAAAKGQVELLDLRLDGIPLAMLVNFICTPGSFSFKTAFDERYARFSPGVLLQLENLALLERGDVEWCDSCAAEGHPMIDSLWTGRRGIGRYSVAIGGGARRGAFGLLLRAELEKKRARTLQMQQLDPAVQDEQT